MPHTAFSYIDPFHRHVYGRDTTYTKRMLTGRIFGVDIPAWVIFHAMLGYALLLVGLLAMTLRLPLKPIRKRRWLHRHIGYVWIFGTAWMPISAIWCVRSSFGWNIVAFYIFSMYATIQLAWLCIRAYKSRRRNELPLLDSEGSTPKARWKTLTLLVLHAVLMFYSFVMLLGAGIAFPFRAFDVYSN